MPTTTDKTTKPSSQAKRTLKSHVLPRPGAIPAASVKPGLPPKSIQKAASVFKHFNLSKFSGSPVPSNYVAAGKGSADVQSAQRKIIAHRMEKLSKAGESNRSMTLAFPEAKIKSLLPSYNAKAGTIELSDVMTLIAKNMRGTEFYTNGNPTLNRLALQSEVQQIIATVKQGGKK